MDRQDINFTPVFIHQEEEPNVTELNANTTNIMLDINHIDNTLIESAIGLNNLIENSKAKLSNIKKYLAAEKERQEDMNILCNRYTDFASVINLKSVDFSGNLNTSDDIVSAAINSNEKVSIDINEVNGNGYEGNSYVYDKTGFVSETLRTDLQNSLTDGNLATYYEYSRITTSETINGAPILFNKDSLDAECSIEIKSEKLFNKIVIYSDRDDIVLSKVFTSKDGLTYKLDKEYNVVMNERYDRYNNQGYIYGSGVIAVEPTTHVKVFLRSKGHTNDTIAFENTFYTSNGENTSVIKKIEVVNNAKRHVVKVNDISAFRNQYTQGMLLSKELITDPIKTIALHCNEYINDGYTLDNNVTYYLIINGVEHEIKPINSHRNGKKILRMSAHSSESEHVTYLNENIKSAKLKIVINSTNQDITPYVSDIKILIGGGINE